MGQAKHVDGRAVLGANLVQNLCNGRTYTVNKFPVEDGADVTIVRDADDEHIGSDVRSSGLTASFSLISPSVDDQDPGSATAIRNGHVLLHRTRYYAVSKIKIPYELKSAVVISGDATQIVNPIVSDLLSIDGQFKAVTGTTGATFSRTCTAVNTRAGATLTWSLYNNPAGMTINSTTGAISYPTAVAGTYVVDVIVKDVVAGEKDRQGYGVMSLKIS